MSVFNLPFAKNKNKKDLIGLNELPSNINCKPTILLKGYIQNKDSGILRNTRHQCKCFRASLLSKNKLLEFARAAGHPSMARPLQKLFDKAFRGIYSTSHRV